ncbi:hypothetical protein TNCV_2452031 [Trichonephila clavipes]|nr:hypothetical protein TNCV_2452031 [Trichonephila clavipes]
MSSSRVPLKPRRVEEPDARKICRGSNVLFVVWKLGDECQLKCRPRHLTEAQNFECKWVNGTQRNLEMVYARDVLTESRGKKFSSKMSTRVTISYGYTVHRLKILQVNKGGHVEHLSPILTSSWIRLTTAPLGQFRPNLFLFLPYLYLV